MRFSTFVRCGIGIAAVGVSLQNLAPAMRDVNRLWYPMDYVDIRVTYASYLITWGLVATFGFTLLATQLTSYMRDVPHEERVEGDHMFFPVAAWAATFLFALCILVNEEAGLSAGATLYLVLAIITFLIAMWVSRRSWRYFRSQHSG